VTDLPATTVVQYNSYQFGPEVSVRASITPHSRSG
jgi:hypothetical protein